MCEIVQTKCAPYTLETLINNIMAEWARNGEGEARVWMMVGVLVRVALQMGYHRSVFHQVLVQRLTPQLQQRPIAISRDYHFPGRDAAQGLDLCART